MGQRYPVPPPAGSYTPAYVPVITYYGGAYGDDVSQSSANVTNDFTPKTQVQKAAITGQVPGSDIGVRRGWIKPGSPYAAPPASPANDPTITTLAPSTGKAGISAFTVLVTGTNFTEWSTVKTGGVPTPYYKVLSPTQIELVLDGRRSVAGTIDVVVSDHGKDSAPSSFTYT
jgi:hypothetical protein